ncbi:MAG: glycogen synthase GlgA [Eubacteriaceae bacterium]|nr:glycogen synthase GlgA [Eubacteriaceae bacterium]
MRRKPRVLFATSEAVPFMKTGGLGDVAGSLPKELKQSGVEVRVIMPKYKKIDEKYTKRMKHVCDFYMPLGWRNVYCGIEKLTHKGVVYYFVDNEYYFGRDNAYGYFDDGERIAFFSKAIVECLQYLPDFKCDILHCNDWHTALSTVFLREFYNGMEGYSNIKTIFTVHNLKFQGQMSDSVLSDILALDYNKAAADQLRTDGASVNFMKGALCYSDLLSTVSETYAEEIQTDFFGENMQDIYRRRKDVLYGIMNGIDQDEYDPSKSKALKAHFTIDDMEGKRKCKEELQKELGLEVNDSIPLITMCGRLTQQKGLDLVKHVFGEIMDLPVQFAVLGTGDREYEDMFRSFAERYPGKVAACLTFNEPLSHRLYAGGDMLLMPSLFEPCGLSQMIAMRYGTLPIVRETGGLKDSVIPYNKYTGEGTGFSFANYNAHEMLFTIQKAVKLYYEDRTSFDRLIKQAMSCDFSWKAAAEKYIEMYKRLHPELWQQEKPKKTTTKKGR